MAKILKFPNMKKQNLYFKGAVDGKYIFTEKIAKNSPNDYQVQEKKQKSKNLESINDEKQFETNVDSQKSFPFSSSQIIKVNQQ